ncbi:hypothetical protein QYE76_013369 [Lolium multiflorum]|uniref:Uncharacterized protein n=1 Tax=Lolium multiflorum TaxID=4521 RepID=A0AAD8U2T6_LOLMU|nr:hypothetical protein QYE76_013369 [Lolium multiflorum]
MSTFRRNFLFSALKPLLRDSTQCLEVEGILDLRAGGPHRPGTISSGKGKTSAVGAMERKATTHVGSWLSLSCVPSPAKQVGTSRFRAEAMGNENSAPPAAGAWPDLQHKKRNATAELGRDRPGAETAAPLLKWMQNGANEAAVRTMVPAPSSENLYKHEAMGQDETSVPLLKWIKNDPDEAAVKTMVLPPSSENLLKHKATGQLGGTLFSKQTETAKPSLVKRIATAADEASAEAATKLLSAPPSGCLYKLKSKDQPGRNHPRMEPIIPTEPFIQTQVYDLANGGDLIFERDLFALTEFLGRSPPVFYGGQISDQANGQLQWLIMANLPGKPESPMFRQIQFSLRENTWVDGLAHALQDLPYHPVLRHHVDHLDYMLYETRSTLSNSRSAANHTQQQLNQYADTIKVIAKERRTLRQLVAKRDATIHRLKTKIAVLKETISTQVEQLQILEGEGEGEDIQGDGYSYVSNDNDYEPEEEEDQDFHQHLPAGMDTTFPLRIDG